MSKTLDDILTI